MLRSIPNNLAKAVAEVQIKAPRHGQGALVPLTAHRLPCYGQTMTPSMPDVAPAPTWTLQAVLPALMVGLLKFAV